MAHPSVGGADPTSPSGRAAFVILAGGSGTRLGGTRNKVHLHVAGRPMVSWSLDWVGDVPEVGVVVLVVRAGDEDLARAALDAADAVPAGRAPVEVVTGGATRTGSELAALDALAGRIEAEAIDVVVVHDAARPLAGPDLLRTVIRAARARGGAVPTIPADGAWREEAGALTPVTGPLELHAVQTPQAFRAAGLLAAYRRVAAAGVEVTDTAGAVERFGSLDVVAVPGSPDNLKVTVADDLARADHLLQTIRTPPPTPP